MALAPAPRARVPALPAVAGAAVLAWRTGGRMGLALGLLAAALAGTAWLAPAHFGRWQRRLTRGLATTLSWLLLGLVYGGVFVPLRAWAALRGRDPLQRRPRPGAPTYLNAVPPAPAGRFERQF